MKRLLSYEETNAPAPQAVRALLCALACSLMLALACSPALTAFGVEGPQPGPLPGRTERALPTNQDAEPATGEAAATSTPEPGTISAATAPRYFLPNLDQATIAKTQKPWGACWAFAVAAALESSILKAEAALAGQSQAQLAPDSPAFAPLDLTDLPATPDLSERAIAWFAHEPQTEASGGSQAGEGFALSTHSPEEQLSGGNFATAASALTARQGLVLEATAPYEYNGYTPGESAAWFGSNPAYDARTEDWSLPEEVRTTEDSGWRVSEVLRLQSPANVAEDGTYLSYNTQATSAVKRTLVDVGGVAVALSTEQNIPSDVLNGVSVNAEPSESFTFSTWSQYDAASQASQNHAAVILGWDDSYPAANFQGTVSGQPPADGAWLCKNSWGSDALFASLGNPEEASHWGITDANGEASGYFWLSYYDHTITDLEAFVVEPEADSPEVLYQYDFVGAAEYVAPVKYSGLVQAANVFTASSTQLLTAVTGWTFAPNTACAITVGVMPPGFNARTATPDDLMAASTPAARAAAVLPEAGFHTLDLDTPVLVTQDQQFTVTLEIAAAEGALDESTGQLDAQAESFLGVEVAYLDAGVTGQTTFATTVANANETLVCVDGTHWQGIAEFSAERADMRERYGKEPDFVYGSAITKALANTTTMADPSHVYQVVPLSAPEQAS